MFENILYLEKGKEAQKDWNKKENKISLINDCINIEKTVENINKINQTLEKYKLEKISIDFVSDQNGILKSIKNYGKVILDKINRIKYNDFNIQIDDFDPKNLRYNKIITDKCGYGGNYYVYDGICFFISKENDYILGYIDSNSGSKSIIFYDINKENETKKINNAHKREIHIIKYYDYSLFDMILSSSMDDDVKIWNYSDCSNILIISNIFKEYGVFSSCLIFDKNIFHIFCVGNSDYIKMFNCNGNIYNNIGDKNEIRRFIDSCEINDKKYLISGGNKGITVFNYPSLIQYNCFFDKNQENYHNYAKIMKSNDKYILIDIGYFNSIKLWDFLKKNLIANIVSTQDSCLSGLVLINNRYLIVGNQDGYLKEFDIQNQILVKDVKNHHHKSNVLGIKTIKNKDGKIYLASYGTDKNIFQWEL